MLTNKPAQNRSTADFTTANIANNNMYDKITSSLPVTMIRKRSYISADPGYH
jgi:hypothetical protein